MGSTSDLFGERWPFLGRDPELRLIAEAIADPHRSVVTIVGPAGVGKTGLARKALDRAATIGLATAWISGQGATPTSSLGPFAHVLAEADPPGADDPTVHRVVRELLRRREGRRLVLAVDDAHLLDDASAAAVHSIAMAGAVAVVVLPKGELPPPPILALNRDGSAFEIELHQLSRPEVEELLGQLPAAPSTISVEDAWCRTRGNLVLLREVLTRGAEADPLTLATRLHRLGPQESMTLEVLALGEPLGAGVLKDLVGPAALSSLERKGLVRAARSGRRLDVYLEGTLGGVAVEASISPLRAHDLYHRLTASLEGFGARRREDLVRLAVWRLDGGQTDTDVLVEAARRSIEIFRPVQAERLAEKAIEAGAGFSGLLVLATALFEQARGDEAEAALAQLEADASDDEERVEVALRRAQNLFFRLHRPDEADEVLRRAEAVVTPSAGRRNLQSLRCEFLMWSEPPSQVLEAIGHPWAPGRPEDEGRWRLSLAPLARAYAGQPDSALADLDRASDAAEETPFLWSRWWALWLTGRLRDAHDLAQAQYVKAKQGPFPFPASWPMMLGYSLLLRGRPRSARRLLEESVARGTDRWGFRHLCLALLAQAAAQCGDTAAATSAVAGSEEIHHSSLRTHQYALTLAQAWVAASRNELDSARNQALIAAEAARCLGQHPFEAFALHSVVRFDGASLVVERLDELVGCVEGALAPVWAAHARSLAEHDGHTLGEITTTFEAMGATLWAAEAAAQAAACFHSKSDQACAYQLRRRARLLSRQCEDAATPALSLLDDDLDSLTSREREVAELAGAGRSTKDISQRLHIGVRTVENHLHRAYGKLGIDGRAQLVPMHRQLEAAVEGGLSGVPIKDE